MDEIISEEKTVLVDRYLYGGVVWYGAFENTIAGYSKDNFEVAKNKSYPVELVFKERPLFSIRNRFLQKFEKL